jgi:hypothetical protein
VMAGRFVPFWIKAIADKPDSMFIQADKIVDGKAITMGPVNGSITGPGILFPGSRSSGSGS